MELSKCAKKNIARTGTLKVKPAAKPRAKSALCIDDYQMTHDLLK